MNTEKEIWKPIPNFDGYKASNLGRIKSPKKILHPVPQYNGYHRLNIYSSNVHKYKFVHRLILSAFIGESAFQVNHKNGIKSDNRLCNLEYITPQKNTEHAYEIGLRKTRLSAHEVSIIRNSSIPIKYIAKIFKIGRRHVWAIKSNRIKAYNNEECGLIV